MDLEELMANALCLGVAVRLDDCGDAVHLSCFRRTHGPPGAGATVMRSICEYADREGVELVLGAHQAEPKLVAYYRQFGFETNHHQDDEHHNMVRFPQEDEA